MDDNTRKAVNDHKVALAADEEKQRESRALLVPLSHVYELRGEANLSMVG